MSRILWSIINYSISSLHDNISCISHNHCYVLQHYQYQYHQHLLLSQSQLIHTKLVLIWHLQYFFYDFTNTEQLIEDVVTESYNFFNNKYFIFNIILVDLLWLGLVVATFTQLVLFLQTYDFRQTTELIKNEFKFLCGNGDVVRQIQLLHGWFEGPEVRIQEDSSSAVKIKISWRFPWNIFSFVHESHLTKLFC